MIYGGRGLATVLAALALVAGCSAATVAPAAPDGSGFQGAWLDQPYQLPDATLTDTAGEPFNLRTGSDAPVLVFFFGYTNCPDICIGVLTDLATAMNRLPDEVRTGVQVVFVTVDPERDTPEVMRDYLARIDPGFVGLTAPLDTIEAVAAPLGVVVEGTTDVEGGYEVTHSTQVIGFDRDRLGRLVWVQGTPIGSFRADLTEFVRQQA